MTTDKDHTKSNEIYHFPTHASYLVPVVIKETPHHGEGQRGVFAKEPIAKGTKLWVWTHRVKSIHRDDLEDYIQKTFGNDLEETRVFLRQGFVLPPKHSSETMSPPQKQGETTPRNASNDDNFFHSNPTDAGRLTNHSSDPNTGPDGALRDIDPGEEMTMDYSFHGNPEWYQAICARFGVMTEAQIAALHHT